MITGRPAPATRRAATRRHHPPGPAHLLRGESGLLGLVALAASQTAVLTAVLTYFGWARTNATLAPFGLDPSMVDYESADYLLRSISVAFPAAVGATVAGLVLLTVHRGVVVPALNGPRTGRAGRIARRVVAGLRLLTAILIGGLVVAVSLPGTVGAPLGIGLPLLIVAVAALLAYLSHLRRRASSSAHHPTRRAQVVLLTVLGLLGMFWAAGLHADATGRGVAAAIVTTLANRPEIVLFSEHRLYLTGTGVVVDELGATGDRYRFRYSGIRMLVHTKDALMLVPMGWRAGRDHVFAVPLDAGIRLDIGAAG